MKYDKNEVSNAIKKKIFKQMAEDVITSYSIHYTKLYDEDNPNITELEILEKMIEDRNKIISKFKKDDFIISDRSFYSSLAYQGSILGVDTIDGILKNNNLILPDIYIYMDVFSEKAIDVITSYSIHYTKLYEGENSCCCFGYR